ncbi:hypothetical protein BIW11_04933 [Tropilaelaps mercedesae]|uniref:Uncharacterized protein n=1 Tax=Tropilaelaps mercedesae TaxID=418985 RepID=A0A1V9X003_9ACAR|nr:hypothetical protein BIW11_04933 [Tropilaelaps mercedesae]
MFRRGRKKRTTFVLRSKLPEPRIARVAPPTLSDVGPVPWPGSSLIGDVLLLSDSASLPSTKVAAGRVGQGRVKIDRVRSPSAGGQPVAGTPPVLSQKNLKMNRCREGPIDRCLIICQTAFKVGACHGSEVGGQVSK